MKKKLVSALLCIGMLAAMLSGCAASTETGNDPVSPPDDLQKDQTQDTGGDDATDKNNPVQDTVTDDTDLNDTTGGGRKIALSMPTRSVQRWIDDAENMKKELEAKGYVVDVQFAEDNPQQQAAQIKSFVEQKVDCMVVVPIDSKELTDAAKEAKKADIPVISYDRLLMDTDAVYYYASFDNKGVGRIIGQTIAKKADLDGLSDGEYKTIEFFMGCPDDNNSYLIYEGLMEVMQPYLDDGRLVCKSGRTSFEDTCISRWSQDTAREWCKNYLAGYYTDEELDICATAFDGLAYGCREALQAAGYIEDNWPVISGQDCETVACKNILDGTQTFSIYKDTRLLAQKCVTMIDSVVADTEPEINDTEQYHNNVITVPSYLCTPVAVDKDNLKEVLIDSGYYTQEQIDNAE